MPNDKRKKVSDDTIAAVATPLGRGGVGIVRVSGPAVPSIAKHLLGGVPKPRYATHRAFKKNNQTTLDEGIALFFPAPNSFTGEDVLELQGHGGPIVLDQVMQCVIQAGARLARPGEFSERAFLNGKIDLTQAEAIADLIHAQSEDAARSAMRSLQGDFSARIQTVLASLIGLRIFVEAAIDFPEEEIDFIGESDVQERLDQLIRDVAAIEKTASQGALLQEGMRLAIVGEPNVGKSSLLNRLTGKESAIVTEIPGTTRDLLREAIHLDGMPLHIVDTAGLRDTTDPVEKEGIRRARKAAEEADLVIFMMDATRGEAKIPTYGFSTPVLVVKNKMDLMDQAVGLDLMDGEKTIKLSAKTGEGMDALKQELKAMMGYEATQEGTFSARRRHLDALKRTQMALLSGREQLTSSRAAELLAEELRLAQQALNEITGEFTSDDLLGEIFSNFCIGK